jgi:HK97 family phage major capsid protein
MRIQDSNNRPIWQDSMAAGVPPLLLGFPVWVSDAMPAPLDPTTTRSRSVTGRAGI